MVDIFKNNNQERERNRIEVIRYYLKRGLKTVEDLHRFVTTLTREKMPFKSICPHHQSPFHYLANAFFADRRDPVSGKWMGKVNQIVIASRGGGKTATTGKLNTLDLIFKPGIEIASVGAIKQQAEKCYAYTRGFLYDPELEHLVKDSVMAKTEMFNGSSYSQLIGTMTGVNSPHPQKLRADEVELLRSDSVLEEMFLVPMTKGGYRSSLDIISTRKFQYGIMQRLVEEREAKGFNLSMWCYKEVAEKCTKERRGEKRVWLDIEDPETLEVTPIKMYEGCEHCALAFSCRGDLARAEGYYAIDDLILELKRTSKRTWKAQKECDRPGIEGLVYPSFYDRPGDALSTVIPNCGPPPGWIVVEGWDFGTRNPTAVVFIAIRPDGEAALIFDEYYKAGATVNAHTKAVIKLRAKWHLQPRMSFGDPSGLSMRLEYAQRGIKIVKGFRNLEVGIDIVNRFFERGQDGSQKLKICERCVETRREHKFYHFKENRDEPADKDDHTCDAARYGLATGLALLKYGYLDVDMDEDTDGSYRPKVLRRPVVTVRP